MTMNIKKFYEKIIETEVLDITYDGDDKLDINKASGYIKDYYHLLEKHICSKIPDGMIHTSNWLISTWSSYAMKWYSKLLQLFLGISIVNPHLSNPKATTLVLID